MSYQTSSKRSPPFWLLIGARKTQVSWHQSEARTAATVWNWSGKTLSPGAFLAVLYFSSSHIFFRPFKLFLVPTICPWVSEDGTRWNGPNSHSAYSIRGVQETSHKTVLLRGSGDLGLRLVTVNRLDFVPRLGAGMCLRF